MVNRRGDLSAFPRAAGEYEGISRREYFAGQALPALLAAVAPRLGEINDGELILEVVENAYHIADRMVEEGR